MNKTRHTILLATLILTTLVLGACSIGDVETVRGSGNVVEETRAVSDVTGVELATIGNLTIELGDTESLRIEAEDNLMEYLETEVRSGSLRIGTQGNVSFNATKPVNYYLTVTHLDTIVISSVGDIQAPDVEAGQFSITIDSTGDLAMGTLTADMLEVDINSTGNLDIEGGKIRSQNITIDSSGNYSAQNLASEEADVRLNSTGSATIWVQDQLKARLTSTGDLRYRGNPTVDETTNSTGDVIQVGE